MKHMPNAMLTVNCRYRVSILDSRTVKLCRSRSTFAKPISRKRPIPLPANVFITTHASPSEEENSLLFHSEERSSKYDTSARVVNPQPESIDRGVVSSTTQSDGGHACGQETATNKRSRVDDLLPCENIKTKRTCLSSSRTTTGREDSARQCTPLPTDEISAAGETKTKTSVPNTVNRLQKSVKIQVHAKLLYMDIPLNTDGKSTTWKYTYRGVTRQLPASSFFELRCGLVVLYFSTPSSLFRVVRKSTTGKGMAAFLLSDYADPRCISLASSSFAGTRRTKLPNLKLNTAWSTVGFQNDRNVTEDQRDAWALAARRMSFSGHNTVKPPPLPSTCSTPTTTTTTTNPAASIAYVAGTGAGGVVLLSEVRAQIDAELSSSDAAAVVVLPIVPHADSAMKSTGSLSRSSSPSPLGIRGEYATCVDDPEVLHHFGFIADLAHLLLQHASYYMPATLPHSYTTLSFLWQNLLHKYPTRLPGLYNYASDTFTVHSIRAAMVLGTDVRDLFGIAYYAALAFLVSLPPSSSTSWITSLSPLSPSSSSGRFQLTSYIIDLYRRYMRL